MDFLDCLGLMENARVVFFNLYPSLGMQHFLLCFALTRISDLSF